MALIFKLANTRIKSQLFLNRNGFLPLISLMRPVSTSKAKQAEPAKVEGHDERNMRLGRPQSPHLSIYAPQLTAVLSISHRGMGMILSAYLIALGFGALLLPDTIPCYIDKLKCAEIGEEAMTALKFMVAFPFTYHYFNGIRHLIWDTGSFLSIKPVYITGYIMLFFAIGTAIALSLL